MRRARDGRRLREGGRRREVEPARVRLRRVEIFSFYGGEKRERKKEINFFSKGGPKARERREIERKTLFPSCLLASLSTFSFERAVKFFPFRVLFFKCVIRLLLPRVAKGKKKSIFWVCLSTRKNPRFFFFFHSFSLPAAFFLSAVSSFRIVLKPSLPSLGTSLSRASCASCTPETSELSLEACGGALTDANVPLASDDDCAPLRCAQHRVCPRQCFSSPFLSPFRPLAASLLCLGAIFEPSEGSRKRNEH